MTTQQPPGQAAPSEPSRPTPAPAPAPAPGVGLFTAAGLSGAAAVLAAFEAIGAGLELLAGVDAHALPGEVLHGAVRDLEIADRRLAGVRATLYTVAEAQGLWALHGARSFPAWVRTQTQASPAKAAAITRTARALRDHLPATAAALRAGTISTEHAAILAKHTTTTPTRLHALNDPEAGETFLLEHAEELDAADFTNLVKHWAITTDPDAGDRTWAADLSTEELTLSKTLNGYHLTGWLSLVNGAALDTALRAQTATPAPGDQRTSAQRRAGALTNIIGRILDSATLTPHAATEAHLNIHVSHDTLIRLAQAQAPQPTTTTNNTDADPGTGAGTGAGSTSTCGGTGTSAGAGTGADADEPTPGLVIPADLNYDALTGAAPAELHDGTPIPHALLARLACACKISRTIFGTRSEVLDQGRTKRLFTTGQRRAIIARDRHCQYPGCNAPPTHGQIHHSIWWYAQHGTTRAADGILLCWHHHDHVHANAITITRTTTNPSTSTTSHARHTPQGHWQFFTRHGQQIHDPRTTGPHHTRHDRT